MSKTINDFVVFILTHGRPDSLHTLKTLKQQGYSGEYYIVIDNEDSTADRYHELYGDRVLVFDKKASAETFDEADNFSDRRAIVYARNACFDLAEKVGARYFLELDDDYTQFKFRINGRLEHPTDYFKVRTTLDDIFYYILEYFKTIPALSIATMQGGDFFGGEDSFGKFKRKCMNTFFCDTERRFKFVGRINEDVNTYTCEGSRGGLFFSIPFIQVDQLQTQSNDGGMTDIYLDNGTYIKSFYSVMFHPSSVTIGLMGSRNQRLHHSIDWDRTVPKIVRESVRYSGV